MIVLLKVGCDHCNVGLICKIRLAFIARQAVLLRHTFSIRVLYCSVLLFLLRNQVAQRQIIHNILHILDSVLQSIALPSQDVILQVENLEARKHIFDELVDEERALIVSERDGVARKTSLTQNQ